jgi:hypothetical protein
LLGDELTVVRLRLQTIRLVSKDGTERYEMQPNETVNDLKKKARHITAASPPPRPSLPNPFDLPRHICLSCPLRLLRFRACCTVWEGRQWSVLACGC